MHLPPGILVGLWACGAGAPATTDCLDGFVDAGGGVCEVADAEPPTTDGSGGGGEVPTPTDTTSDSGPSAADWVSPATGYGMRHLPAGAFDMGCTPEVDGVGPDITDSGASLDACAIDELPVHVVTLTRDIYLGVTEVTQGQWEAVMSDNPSRHADCGSDCPVESVSWWDAVAFANALSALDELDPAYDVDGNVDLNASGYRLPTEAEWEYAARGGGDDTAFAGSTDLDTVGWYDGNSGYMTQPVAELAPNGFGLYDMSGNVWEWCGDWNDQGYYAASPAVDPTGPPDGEYRSLRGGDYSLPLEFARVAGRHGSRPVPQIETHGLRLARTVP